MWRNINPGRGSAVMRWIIPAATEHFINSYPSLLRHWDFITELKLGHAAYGKCIGTHVHSIIYSFMMRSTRSLIYSMTYCDFPLQLTGLLWLWDQGEKKCISTEILGFVQDGRKAYTVSAATLFIRGKLKNHAIQ